MPVLFFLKFFMPFVEGQGSQLFSSCLVITMGVVRCLTGHATGGGHLGVTVFATGGGGHLGVTVVPPPLRTQ